MKSSTSPTAKETNAVIRSEKLELTGEFSDDTRQNGDDSGGIWRWSKCYVWRWRSTEESELRSVSDAIYIRFD